MEHPLLQITYARTSKLQFSSQNELSKEISTQLYRNQSLEFYDTFLESAFISAIGFLDWKRKRPHLAAYVLLLLSTAELSHRLWNM